MTNRDAKPLLAEIRRAAGEIRNGRRTEALLIYREVRHKAGREPVIQYQLGQLCLDFGDADQALEHFGVAAEQDGDNVLYLAALGLTCQNSGQQERAREILEKALALDADNPDVLHGLGTYYMHRSDFARAREYLERACRARPGDATIRTNLATSLTELTEHELAIGHARKALKQDDANPLTHLALCTALTQLGRMDEATRHLEQTVRRHPTFGTAYDLLARIRKFSAADDAFIRKAEKMLDRGMPVRDRYCLHFALGKMQDDCGNYAEAFAHYEQANLLQRTDYDPAADRQLLKDMRTAFEALPESARIGLGHPSEQPVFVVGMPRSGTTLIEQMIASHPAAAGAGELAAIPSIAAELFPVDERRRVAARARSELTAERVLELAEAYLGVLRQGRADALRIVDKMPSNFFFLGLITTLFPGASIIHVDRHPLDTCLSCFFQSFGELPWSNELQSIAAFYSVYRDAMSCWRRVLPAGKILDVRYEQLVEDPETEARRMIAHCDLAWVDAVLDFPRRESVVRTASVAQARQPVYKTSKQRWINYAPHLGELAADLAGYLEDDRELLARHGIDLGRGRRRPLFRRLFAGR